jgi:hypothetical protein
MKLHNTTLKNSLLLIAIATYATLSTATAAALNDDAATPQRRASTDAAYTVEQTPWQKISRMISETLTVEKFSQVLSADEMQSIDINWEALSNPDLPFDHPDIRSSLVRLMRVLKRLLPERFSNPNLIMLWGQISIIDASITSVHWDRLKELTSQYFNSISCEVIGLALKLDGVQFGAKATVRLQNGRAVKYHIKTHSGGLTSEKSSAPSLVNPAELLVYKVLEGLGVGCQSHFFGHDGHNLYIATLDANTEGEFKEYSHYKGSKHTDVQKQVWGELTQLTEDIKLSDEQHRQAEDWIAADPVAKTCVHELSKQDLLARMLLLTDFQTNTGNYGFTRLKDGSLRVKAIDFRLSKVVQIDQYRCSQGSFESFLSGHGLYHYISADKVMCYALRHRQKELRVQEARNIMIGELSHFEEIVDRAVLDVSQALNQVTMTDVEKTKTHADLEQYAEIIKSNFGLFRDQLEQWRPVTTSAE